MCKCLYCVYVFIYCVPVDIDAQMYNNNNLGGCVYLWQLRLMVVGVLKHRQTFLDLRRALQLDQIVASPRPLWLSMAG